MIKLGARRYNLAQIFWKTLHFSTITIYSRKGYNLSVYPIETFLQTYIRKKYF